MLRIITDKVMVSYSLKDDVCLDGSDNKLTTLRFIESNDTAQSVFLEVSAPS